MLRFLSQDTMMFLKTISVILILLPGVLSDPPGIPSVSVNPPGEVIEGRRVTLTCSSDANPPADIYTWFKGRRSISTGPQLVKENVSPADSGQYICRVTNKHGSQTSPPHSLDVQYPPGIPSVSVNPPGGVIEGSKVTLTCSSDANPPADIYTWFKGQRSISTAPQLVKEKVSPADSGQYICQVTNKHGSLMSSPHSLDVQMTPWNISISMDPPGDVVEGRKVTLTCSSDVNPPADIYTWYRDTGNSSISTGPQLVKENVSPPDSGQYSCQVTNKHGSQMSPPTFMNVLYAPVSVLVEVCPSDSVAEGGRVNLICSADANPAVHSYTWYQRTPGPAAGSSGSLVQVGSGGQVLVLTSLQLHQTGRYFCQTRNSVGETNSTEVLLQMIMDSTHSDVVVLRVVMGVKLLAVLLFPLLMLWLWKQGSVVDNAEDGPDYVNITGSDAGRRRGLLSSADQDTRVVEEESNM